MNVFRYPTPLFLLVICTTLGVAARAQTTPEMRILRLDTAAFPLLRMDLSVKRVDQTIPQLTRANFTAYESASPQDIIDVVCPADSLIRMSALLLIDRSGSMARIGNQPDPDSTKIRAAKAAVVRFIELLDPRDEASICSFSSDIGLYAYFTVACPFGSDTAAMKRSLVPIEARGGTMLWDAMMESLRLLRGRTGKRILIALTDGVSQQDRVARPPDVIAEARADNIPIHLVGLGADVNADIMKYVASSTGGRYYAADSASELADLFSLIAHDVLTDNCVLRYRSTHPCRDGTTRLVQITCTGAGFTAEADTAYTIPNGLWTGSLFTDALPPAASDNDIELPVLLSTPLAGGVPFSFSLEVRGFGPTLEFAGIGTANALCDGAIVRVDTLASDAYRIDVEDHLASNPSLTLLSLKFHVAPIPRDTAVTIRFENTTFTQSCPLVVTAIPAVVELRRCEEHYRIVPGFPPAPQSGRLRIPLGIAPVVPAGRNVSGRLDIDFDPSIVTPAGAELTTGGRKSPASISVQGGRMTVEFDRMSPVDSLFLALDLRVPPRRDAVVTSLRVIGGSIETGCATDFAGDVMTIYVDGSCDFIMERVASNARVTVSPNPASRGIDVRFTMNSDGFHRLMFVDPLGQTISTIAEGWLEAGVHHARFSIPPVANATYYVILRTEDAAFAAPVNVIR